MLVIAGHESDSRLLKTVLIQGVRSPLSKMNVFVGLVPSRHVLYRPLVDPKRLARPICWPSYYPLARVRGSLTIHRSNAVCEYAARSHRSILGTKYIPLHFELRRDQLCLQDGATSRIPTTMFIRVAIIFLIIHSHQFNPFDLHFISFPLTLISQFSLISDLMIVMSYGNSHA